MNNNKIGRGLAKWSSEYWIPAWRSQGSNPAAGSRSFLQHTVRVMGSVSNEHYPESSSALEKAPGRQITLDGLSGLNNNNTS